MKYSTRVCHGESKPFLKVGMTVAPGDALLKMGNTGESRGKHFHVDSVVGWYKKHWHVKEFELGIYEPAPEQTNYLIGEGKDSGFFVDSLPHITEPFFSSTYTRIMKKRHWGSDVIPVDINSDAVAHWNRSKKGEVVFSGFDPGYGFSIIINFEG